MGCGHSHQKGLIRLAWCDADFYPRVRDGGWSVQPHTAVCKDTKVEVGRLQQTAVLPGTPMILFEMRTSQ